MLFSLGVLRCCEFMLPRWTIKQCQVGREERRALCVHQALLRSNDVWPSPPLSLSCSWSPSLQHNYIFCLFNWLTEISLGVVEFHGISRKIIIFNWLKSIIKIVSTKIWSVLQNGFEYLGIRSHKFKKSNCFAISSGNDCPFPCRLSTLCLGTFWTELSNGRGF